jgi:triacylglycerol lipase
LNLEPAQCALLAYYAEQMFAPGVLAPPLDHRAAGDWKIVGYLTAANALFGAQQVGLGERVYYGFLAQSTQVASEWIAIVRGTEQNVEWLENIEGLLVPGPPIGWVEQGFYSIYSSMRLATNNLLAAQGITNRVPAGASLTVIGHSLGSAIATYLMRDVAAIPFTATQRNFSVGGCLFASPRTGDSHFVKNVDDEVGNLNYAVYNSVRDVVPHVPPSLSFGLGFQDLPGVKWLTPAKSQANIQNNPGCNHSAMSYAAMLDFSSVQGNNGGCILSAGPAAPTKLGVTV